MAYRMDLPQNEIVDILNFTYTSSKRIGYTLPSGIHVISDRNNLLESFLLSKVIDDFKLSSVLNNIQTLQITILL